MGQPTPFAFEGRNVYLLNDLITFDRQFFVRCIKPRKAIQKKNIPEDQYWFASTRKARWALSNAKNKKAKILISEDWVHSNLLLPKFADKPLLELSEDEKFKDEQGAVYEVEVRGEKTKHGIWFKWSDISRLFEMEPNHLHKLDKTEYDVFCSTTYLTYNGLLKIIFTSQSDAAYRFKDWATKIIYATLITTQHNINDHRFKDWATNIIYAAHLGDKTDYVQKQLFGSI